MPKLIFTLKNNHNCFNLEEDKENSKSLFTSTNFLSSLFSSSVALIYVNLSYYNLFIFLSGTGVLSTACSFVNI